MDTIGGWFLALNFDVKMGSEIEDEGYLFKVHEIDGHHIQYLEVQKI